MSGDLDGRTMGQLVEGGAQHDVTENPSADVLLVGTVLIGRDADGAKRAIALRDQVNRAIATLAQAGLAVLVAVAVLAAATVQGMAQAPRPTWVPRIAAERSWPVLTREQLAALNKALRKIASTRVEIYCAGNYCHALAEDLDEAFESAGHDAYLEVPLFDMGKGLGISPANDDTRAIAATIEKLTHGKVMLPVFDPIDAKGNKIAVANKIVIGIARKPH